IEPINAELIIVESIFLFLVKFQLCDRVFYSSRSSDTVHVTLPILIPKSQFKLVTKYYKTFVFGSQLQGYSRLQQTNSLYVLTVGIPNIIPNIKPILRLLVTGPE